MSALAIDNIGLLVTNDPSLGSVRDAALVVVDGRVSAVERAGVSADERLDAGGGCVIPGFVDSHTHLVFAGDRGDEFAARMAGAPYSPRTLASRSSQRRRRTTSSNPKARASGNPSRRPGVSSAWGGASYESSFSSSQQQSRSRSSPSPL